MAQNTTISLVAGQWTAITNSTCTAIRVDPNGATVELQATVSAVAPGAVAPGSVVISQPTFMKLNEIWIGVAGADRVYARAVYVAANVSVSHD